MNTSLVHSIPQGDFAEVSVLKTDWLNKIELLVNQKKLIKYDMYPLSGIPSEVRNQLDQNGYSDFVLEYDRWQHFLVPNAKPARG
jgi:hypothetical protein